MPEYGLRYDCSGNSGHIALSHLLFTTILHLFDSSVSNTGSALRLSILSILTACLIYNRYLQIILYYENKYNILFHTALFSSIVDIEIQIYK